MDFLQTILDNPNTLMNIPTKKGIDPLTHDFDSESISDRLFSLLSVMDNITHEDLTKEDSINQAILELKAADKITQDFMLNNHS